MFAFRIAIALLLEAPVDVCVLKFARAHPKARETLYWSLAGFVICSGIVAVFYLGIGRTLSKYAPLCPVAQKQ